MMAVQFDASGLLLVGRVLLGGLFLVAGLRHLPIMAAMAERLRERRAPFPLAIMWAGTIFETIAGALLIVGIAPQAVCLALAVFTLLASALMYDFWRRTGEARQQALNGWQNNIGLVGGLLIAAAVL